MSIGKTLSSLKKLDLIKKAKSGIQWFRDLIKGLVSGKAPSNFNPKSDPFIGGMFSYIYDPKWKDTLPYWDKFPLVIPIEIYSDGFLALNLHYLPPNLRVALLDDLITTKTASKNKDSYMKISYAKLHGVSKSNLFAPCIKRYLSDHIRSKIVKIDPEDWEKVAVLPTQQFQKASAQQVWRNR